MTGDYLILCPRCQDRDILSHWEICSSCKIEVSPDGDGRNWQRAWQEEQERRQKQMLKNKSERVCIWKVEPTQYGDTYETECENTFQFTEGTPEENHFEYCPYCGGLLAAMDFYPKWAEEEEPAPEE